MYACSQSNKVGQRAALACFTVLMVRFDNLHFDKLPAQVLLPYLMTRDSSLTSKHSAGEGACQKSLRFWQHPRQL